MVFPTHIYSSFIFKRQEYCFSSSRRFIIICFDFTSRCLIGDLPYIFSLFLSFSLSTDFAFSFHAFWLVSYYLNFQEVNVIVFLIFFFDINGPVWTAFLNRNKYYYGLYTITSQTTSSLGENAYSAGHNDINLTEHRSIIAISS